MRPPLWHVLAMTLWSCRDRAALVLRFCGSLLELQGASCNSSASPRIISPCTERRYTAPSYSRSSIHSSCMFGSRIRHSKKNELHTSHQHPVHTFVRCLCIYFQTHIHGAYIFHACMYEACMKHVCMFICIYVCAYACMYVYGTLCI
jgi:hypothetical protein